MGHRLLGGVSGRFFGAPNTSVMRDPVLPYRPGLPGDDRLSLPSPSLTGSQLAQRCPDFVPGDPAPARWSLICVIGT